MLYKTNTVYTYPLLDFSTKKPALNKQAFLYIKDLLSSDFAFDFPD